ncbi:MAG: hypothetical protein M3406_02235 [Chloroflexota bacterium]|nr:hypothetical protein [Chloroflexota bacterium]
MVTAGGPATYGPNTADVRAMLDHASVLLPGEMRGLGQAMIEIWSYGRVDGRFPPFVAALGAACTAAVSSGRLPAVRAARAAVRTPEAGEWDRFAPVAAVGMRVTVAALVVADLLAPDQVELLLGPWHAVEAARPAIVRGAA